MKILGFVCLFQVIIVIKCNSQDSIPANNNKNAQIKIHLIVPGITVEQYLSNSISINYQIASGFAFYFISSNSSNESDIMFWPYISMEPRFYIGYKLDDNQKFKSGKYLGLNCKAGLPTDENYATFLCGPLFGYKKQFQNSFYFDFGIGIGATYENKNYSASLISNIQLGFLLNLTN